jgi:hypothetical protein
MKYQIDNSSKTITLSELPEAELIGFDPEIEYYDIKQSLGNKFSEQELNALNKNAIDLIKADVMNSELPNLAKQMVTESLKAIMLLSYSAGWNFIDQTKTLPPANKTTTKAKELS